MKLPKHMTYTKLALAIALIPALSMSVQAGEVIDFAGSFGDGYILVDEADGLMPPGVNVITTNPNNDDFTAANGYSPQNAENCILASSGAVCDGPQGSSKRVKTKLTGFNPFDTVY